MFLRLNDVQFNRLYNGLNGFVVLIVNGVGYSRQLSSTEPYDLRRFTRSVIIIMGKSIGVGHVI